MPFQRTCQQASWQPDRMLRRLPVVMRAALLLMVLTVTGCGTSSSRGPDASDRPSQPTRQSPAAGQNAYPGLAPAYGQGPGASPCDVPRSGTVVTMIIGPDVPMPRCVRVRPAQRLELTNGTAISGLAGRRIVLRLAGYPVTHLDPGGHITFRRPTGDVLAPGLHCLRVSIWPGSCADIWMVK